MQSMLDRWGPRSARSPLGLAFACHQDGRFRGRRGGAGLSAAQPCLAATAVTGSNGRNITDLKGEPAAPRSSARAR